ncbi:MAG: outer membrane beta-barrel domain-containing protein [Bdellovibrio sp.]
MSKILPRFSKIILFASLTTTGSHLFAQESNEAGEQKDIDFVERLIESNSNKFEVVQPAEKKANVKINKAEYAGVQSESFYSDLAVIQRNYMPKTQRIHLSGGLSLLPSDVFYRTIGVNLKASFHLNETWGIETFGYTFSSQARDEIKDMENTQKLDVKNLVSVKAFYGVNVYFNSLYGKTAFVNRRIIPFEIYQTLGIGKVRTQDSQESTSLQIGIGDMFSLSRSSTFRVDLTWAFYNAHNYLGEDQASNSLFLTLSYGRLFPEPTYR